MKRLLLVRIEKHTIPTNSAKFSYNKLFTHCQKYENVFNCFKLIKRSKIRDSY